MKTENKYFNNKESYVAFRNAWKDFIHQGLHKKYKVIIPEKEQYYWKSDLNVLHHLIHSLLRNKDLKKSFNVDNNLNQDLIQHFNETYRYIDALHKNKDDVHALKYMEIFMKPFGTLTLDTARKAMQDLKALGYPLSQRFS